MTTNTRTARPNVLSLFENNELVKICAPMVRYSKLQFRTLVRNYGCDLCYTPMILADSFCKSPQARQNEFTTNLNDAPLITQFAANTVHDFVGAAHLVSPYCDGVDLNCGCPQRWAKLQGLGCVMVEKPQLVYDIVRGCRNHIARPFTVSVKIRLKKNWRKTVEFCRQLEHCGVSFLAVHGRTPDQHSTGCINEEALRIIAESVNVPVVANGGVKTFEDISKLQESTKCRGVMVASGILGNPTLFAGNRRTTVECVQKWVDICYNTTLAERDEVTEFTIPEKPNNLTFQCLHHHLVFMLEKLLSRSEKRIFNNLQTFADVLKFVRERFEVQPRLFDEEQFSNTGVCELDYEGRADVYHRLKPSDIDSKGLELIYNDSSDGKFFKAKIQEEEGCDWANIFAES